MRQDQEPPEPVPPGPPERLDFRPRVGPADDRTQGLNKTSPSECFVVRSILGSSNAAKYSAMGAPVASAMAILLAP